MDLYANPLGVAGGHVQLDAGAADFVGVMEASSVSAELSAIIWAMAYAIQSGHPRICIMYDCEFAGKVSQALWDTTAHGPAVSLARGLYMVLSSMAATTVVHVKSHSDHPWNEMAEVSADRAVAGAAPFASRCAPFVPTGAELVQSSSVGAPLCDECYRCDTVPVAWHAQGHVSSSAC